MHSITHMYMHTCTCTHVPTHSCTYTRMDAYMLIHTCTCMHTHRHTYTYAHGCTHVQCINTHARTQGTSIYTYACMYACMYVHEWSVIETRIACTCTWLNWEPQLPSRKWPSGLDVHMYMYMHIHPCMTYAHRMASHWEQIVIRLGFETPNHHHLLLSLIKQVVSSRCQLTINPLCIHYVLVS